MGYNNQNGGGGYRRQNFDNNGNSGNRNGGWHKGEEASVKRPFYINDLYLTGEINRIFVRPKPEHRTPTLIFSIVQRGTSKEGKDYSKYFTISYFGKGALHLSKYVEEGDTVFVHGRIGSQPVRDGSLDKSGKTIYTNEITAVEVGIIPNGDENKSFQSSDEEMRNTDRYDQNTQDASYDDYRADQRQRNAGNHQEDSGEGDIPF